MKIKDMVGFVAIGALTVIGTKVGLVICDKSKKVYAKLKHKHNERKAKRKLRKNEKVPN